MSTTPPRLAGAAAGAAAAEDEDEELELLDMVRVSWEELWRLVVS